MSNKILITILVVALSAVLWLKSSDQPEYEVARVVQETIVGATSPLPHEPDVLPNEASRPSSLILVRRQQLPVTLELSSPAQPASTDEVYIDPNKEILAKEKEHLAHAAELDSMALFQSQDRFAPPVSTTVYADRPVD